MLGKLISYALGKLAVVDPFTSLRCKDTHL